jgi:photosystem II stability/assembly factor-like uncharacterized protein
MTRYQWTRLPVLVLLLFSLYLLTGCQQGLGQSPSTGLRTGPSPNRGNLSCWEPFSQGLPSYALTLAVAADPSQPGVLYAGAYHPPGLWRSDDDGQTWLRDDQGLKNQPVFTLHWDPVRSRWWVGAGDGLYARSTQSEAWQPTDLPRSPAYALAQDRAGQLILALAGVGLFRSADGETWSPLPMGKGLGQSPSPNREVLALAVSPDGQELYVGTAGHGLWISHDAGMTWASVPQMADDYVSALLVDPEAGTWAYARTLSQVYRSDDRGRTWVPVPDLDRRAYSFALGADGAHYVGLNGQVARSDDGGLHWTFFDNGLHPGTDVLDLAVVPNDPIRLYAAAWEGFYRSEDGGQTWKRCSQGLGNVEVDALAWDSQGRLLAGTRMGIYRWREDADRWEPLPQGFQDQHVQALEESGPEGQVFYAGTDGGLLRSDDGGQTWVEVISGLTGRGMPDLAVDPQSPEHLYIRLKFERVYESWDGGQNWEARWEGLGAAREVISIDLGSSGLLVAGANDGLFRWASDEGHWQRVAPGLEGQTVFTVVIDPQDETLVYAGATDGLWRSQDGGDSWSRWGDGLAGITVTAVGLDPVDEQVAYAGTMYEGLYVTEDGGATWRPEQSGVLTTTSVRAILLSPALRETKGHVLSLSKGPDGQQVYVATDQGVFRRRSS